MDTAPIPQTDQPPVVKQSVNPKWMALIILLLLFTILLILSPSCSKLNPADNQSPFNNNEEMVDNDDYNTTDKLVDNNINDNQPDQPTNNSGDNDGDSYETTAPPALSCQANGYTATDVQGITRLDEASLIKFMTAKIANGDQALKDIQGLTCLESLTILNDGSKNITDLTPLAKLTQLQILEIDGTNATDLSPLNNLTNLRRLMIANSPITNLTGIKNLTNLTFLNLAGNDKLIDISTLRNLTKLIDLGLAGTNITDLSPITSLKNLETLTLFNTNWSAQVLVDGINPLTDPDWQSKLIYPPEIQALFTTNPNLEINWVQLQIK